MTVGEWILAISGVIGGIGATVMGLWEFVLKTKKQKRVDTFDEVYKLIDQTRETAKADRERCEQREEEANRRLAECERTHLEDSRTIERQVAITERQGDRIQSLEEALAAAGIKFRPWVAPTYVVKPPPLPTQQPEGES